MRPEYTRELYSIFRTCMGARMMFFRIVMWGTLPAISRSLIKICPESGTSKRFIQRSKMLLPEPLAPIRQTTSCSEMTAETPLRTSSLPKALEIFRSDIYFIAKGWQDTNQKVFIGVSPKDRPAWI